MKKLLILLGFIFITVFANAQYRGLWFEASQYYQLGDSAVTVWGEDTLTSPTMVRDIVNSMAGGIQDSLFVSVGADTFNIFTSQGGQKVGYLTNDGVNRLRLYTLNNADLLLQTTGDSLAFDVGGSDYVFQGGWIIINDVDTAATRAYARTVGGIDTLFHADTKTWLGNGDTIPKADSSRQVGTFDRVDVDTVHFNGIVDKYDAYETSGTLFIGNTLDNVGIDISEGISDFVSIKSNASAVSAENTAVDGGRIRFTDDVSTWYLDNGLFQSSTDTLPTFQEVRNYFASNSSPDSLLVNSTDTITFKSDTLDASGKTIVSEKNITDTIAIGIDENHLLYTDGSSVYLTDSSGNYMQLSNTYGQVSVSNGSIITDLQLNTSSEQVILRADDGTNIVQFRGETFGDPSMWLRVSDGVTSNDLKVYVDSIVDRNMEAFFKSITVEKTLVDTLITNNDTITGTTPLKDAIEAETLDSIIINKTIRYNESEGVHEFVTGKGDVVWQGALEDLTQVYNNTGATIPNGTPVYVSGANGDTIIAVDYAVASDPDRSLNLVGLTTISISNNDWGFATPRGKVRGINTLDLTAGAKVFLTDSTYDDTIPDYPSEVVIIGTALNSSADGTILVNISDALQRVVVSPSSGYTSGPSGVDYLFGYYNAPTADANLTLGTTVTLGSANIAYGAHTFAVTGGVGTVTGGGVVALVATGTTINSNGTRVAGATDTILSDITTASTDAYFEGAKFIGQATYDLVVVSGAPSAATLDFNYGFVKYNDIFNTDHYITSIESVGVGAAAETGFNIELIHHKSTGWTYAATGFVPGSDVITSLADDYVTEKDVANGIPFAYKRGNLSQFIKGTIDEGFILRVTTGTNNSIEGMNTTIVTYVDR